MPDTLTIVGDIDKFYLHPGEIFCNKKPYLVDTILGSCVSVFLWDSVLQFAGINHYMLPSCNNAGQASYKYGDVAIPEIINRMLQMGSSRNNLKAKIFGGSEMGYSNSAFNIGQRNLALAKDLLNDEKIPVINQSIGGNIGRKVIFHTLPGEVFISYIKQDIHFMDKENNPFYFNATGR